MKAWRLAAFAVVTLVAASACASPAQYEPLTTTTQSCVRDGVPIAEISMITDNEGRPSTFRVKNLLTQKFDFKAEQGRATIAWIQVRPGDNLIIASGKRPDGDKLQVQASVPQFCDVVITATLVQIPTG